MAKAKDNKIRAAVWGASAGLIGAPIIGGAAGGYIHGHPWLGIGAGITASLARLGVVGSVHLATPRKGNRWGTVAAVGTALMGIGAIVTYETSREKN
jgi:hypothetical protein